MTPLVWPLSTVGSAWDLLASEVTMWFLAVRPLPTLQESSQVVSQSFLPLGQDVQTPSCSL